MKWYGDTVRAALINKAGKRAEKAAKLLAKMIRENIDTPGPEHSKPGEFPRKQSGELMAGVRVVQRNQYRYDVVSTSDHAEIVERMRPYMLRTLEEQRAALEREAKRR